MAKKLLAQSQVQKLTEKECFVPNCTNKTVINELKRGQRLQFFQVPDGIEGMFWEKAVKIRQRKYDKMIDLLSSTDYMLGLDDVNKTAPKNYEYCCEVHFDIDADIERIITKNGTVDYKVKAGAVPQIKPKQKIRLCDYDEIKEDSEEFCGMDCNIIKEEVSMSDEVTQSNHFQECSDQGATNGYISIVDISTLTKHNTVTPPNECYKANTLVEEPPENSYEPIMPKFKNYALNVNRFGPGTKNA